MIVQKKGLSTVTKLMAIVFAWKVFVECIAKVQGAHAAMRGLTMMSPAINAKVSVPFCKLNE